MLIPYADVETSVNSNCRNSHLIYYKSQNLTVWDSENYILSQKYYNNIFYINTQMDTSLTIVSNLKTKLRNHEQILNRSIPLWITYNM